MNEEIKTRPGRPIEYDEKVHPKLVKGLFAAGLTNSEVCEHIEISTSTLWKWSNEYEEFSSAIKQGKEIADDRVESSLYKKAVGYNVEDVKIFQYKNKPVIVDYIKKYQPDLGAIKMWLNNRQPEKWKEKQEIEHFGNVTLHFDERLKDV